MSASSPRAAEGGGTISDSGPGGPAGAPRVYRLRSHHAPDAVLAAGARTVEDWGGEWTARGDGGDLRLPVQAGLRRGLLRGRAAAAKSGGGSELEVAVDETVWWLDRAAVVLLVTAALAVLALVLWPFFPALAKVAPLGLVLGAGVWLVVLRRLRHEGPAELLAQVEAALEEPEEPAVAEEPPPPIAPR